MEFIKDQEKRILLSALSHEKKLIKDHEELKPLIPVINNLEFYFMYDRKFKSIYNNALDDFKNKILSNCSLTTIEDEKVIIIRQDIFEFMLKELRK